MGLRIKPGKLQELGWTPGTLTDATQMSYLTVTRAMNGDSIGAETICSIWKTVGGSLDDLVEQEGVRETVSEAVA